MPTRLLDKRWPWLLAAAAIVVAFLISVPEIGFVPSDPRPRGSVEDVKAGKYTDAMLCKHCGGKGVDR